LTQFSLGITAAIAHMPPGSTELPPAPLIIVYGIVANVFYGFGPLTECVLEMLWPGKLLPTGPALFRMGLTFSLGLTLLPIIVMGWDWLIRFVTWLI
jgi:hypothetical protein